MKVTCSAGMTEEDLAMWPMQALRSLLHNFFFKLALVREKKKQKHSRSQVPRTQNLT